MRISKLKKEAKTKRETKRERSDMVSFIQSMQTISVSLALVLALLAMAIFTVACPSGSSNSEGNGNSTVACPSGSSNSEGNGNSGDGSSKNKKLRYVVYIADQTTQTTDDVFELYSVPVTGAPAGTEPTKLNGDLASGGEVFSFQISPDCSTVVYFADQDINDVFELYSVPVTGAPAGTEPTKLNGDLASGGEVLSFQISPDCSRVVYRGKQETDGIMELYSVPVTGAPAGSEPIKLNGSLASGGEVIGFSISPDGAKVVYIADQDMDGVNELYSVPITGAPAGTEPTKLNGGLASGGEVIDFSISPDGARVVYHADQTTDAVVELYSVPINGPRSSAIKLNKPLESNRDVEEFLFSPDGATVVYIADQDIFDVNELYSVPIAGPGSSAIKLNDDLTSDRSIFTFRISPDGARVVYRGDQDMDGVIELYSVPVTGAPAGSEPIKLNGSLASGGNVFSDYLISPDGATVVYRADQTTDEIFELYSVPITGAPTGTSPIKLNGTLTTNGAVGTTSPGKYRISPDGARVVYLADQTTNNVNELYSVPIAGPGSSAIKLNDDLTSGRSVFGFRISPDGARVVYLANQTTVAVVELYSVPITGAPTGTTPTTLNDDLVENGNVQSNFKFAFTR